MVKIAVISIGINYAGQSGELRGCVNDSNNFVRWARATFGADRLVVRQLRDTEPPASAQFPTRRNIRRALERVVREAQGGAFTHVWLHYSGHGTQVRDRDGDEVDGFDEALVPVDHARQGYIRDDWIRGKVIERLPAEVKFFGLIDACHSGTIADMRFFLCAGGLKRASRKATSTPNAMMISGCRDDSVSFDAVDRRYGPSGAMTSAFLRAMAAGRRRAAVDVVAAMRRELAAKGYSQVPMLSVSRKVRSSVRLLGIGALRGASD